MTRYPSAPLRGTQAHRPGEPTEGVGAALRVQGVEFWHRDAARPALDGLSFEVRPGTITGLLGPNGAGKTTFVELLCGVLRPQLGHIEVFGLDHRRRDARARLGHCPQDLALYTTLTAAENLRFFARMAGVSRRNLASRVDWCLEAVQLTAHRDQRVEEFSGGMQRRLNLAVAMVHTPRLLVLDEPTVGVDMTSRIAIFDTLRMLAGSGTTILYTTHYMEEIERLCEDVVVIQRGRVLASSPTNELLSAGNAAHVFVLELAEGSDGDVIAALVSLGLHAQALAGGRVEVMGEDLPTLMAGLAHVTGRFSVSACRSKVPTLEDRFLELIGKGERP